MHDWKLYDDGSGAFCVAHHERACMMGMYEVELLLNAHESLRRVARAAQTLLGEHPLWFSADMVQEALDAVPQWVLLDTEEE